MPDINITVAHKVAVSVTQTIVCDNSDYTVHWTLDEEWSAYDTKPCERSTWTARSRIRRLAVM